MTPGSLVSYRKRDWVVLPSHDPNLLLLRPLGGSASEVCAVYKPLMHELRHTLAWEGVSDSRFEPPPPEGARDAAAVRLLLDASRLLLRDGAAPFRSLGHLSVRPRPYQFVPLLMALRLDTVRLLIADDVGVGKTIEGALVAREMLDRGDVDRVAVLCPPYLCDQWQQELADKFHIDAVVMRSGTIARLERQKPDGASVFQHFPHFVASIDLVKSDRYRAGFLQHCPSLVLVDEAHGAASVPKGRRAKGQQQRHDLLLELSARPGQHLVLLSATPHSGVEASFTSLLGLLRPEFRDLRFAEMDEDERRTVAAHFVQRRRPDVSDPTAWRGSTPFPKRESSEDPYAFSPAYLAFYTEVHRFARELVRSAETLTGWRARMRFWSALALLRCVCSSPASAETTLRKRLEGRRGNEDSSEPLAEDEGDALDEAFEPMLYDPTEVESAVDAQPTAVLDAQEKDPDWSGSERKRLRDFAIAAGKLRGKEDAKLQRLVETVRKLLSEGFSPIVWCRFIATSDYVAQELQAALSKELKSLRVTSITGALSDDERRLKVAELGESPKRVLVSTDCLSEGMNLQQCFNAVIHYDLPWNPNRLEQREGRVDRFGQTSPTVKSVLLFGQDNPVDGAVLDVLLRKARDIHRALGIYVPVPVDSRHVMDTIIKSVFAKATDDSGQLGLFETEEIAAEERRRFHEALDEAARREKQTRTVFAQRTIKPEEVERELEATDSVLGDPESVISFLQEASQRLSFGFRERKGGVWELNVNKLPEVVKRAVPAAPDRWRVAFDAPVPEGADYIGRSHKLIESLAEHLMDFAFASPDEEAPAARCGVIRTDAVERRTTLFLLRPRYLIHEAGRDVPALAEETLVWGVEGMHPQTTALDPDQAKSLLDAAPSANVGSVEKREILEEALHDWAELQTEVSELLRSRAETISESHQRIRSLTREKRATIAPKDPPDLLGVLVLVPIPKGVRA